MGILGHICHRGTSALWVGGYFAISWGTCETQVPRLCLDVPVRALSVLCAWWGESGCVQGIFSASAPPTDPFPGVSIHLYLGVWGQGPGQAGAGAARGQGQAGVGPWKLTGSHKDFDALRGLSPQES